ncbi:hypothetical protein MASR2M39_25410 [Ignavibacteriales bacterium]
MSLSRKFQINFDRKSEFPSNDAPGFGASKSDKECQVIAGNTFDLSINSWRIDNRVRFFILSTSDESVENGKVLLSGFDFVDLIAGEEKFTKTKSGLDPVISENYRLFTKQLTNQLTDFLNRGKSLFVSGAYVGTELEFDKTTSDFSSGILKVKLGAEYASTNREKVPE